MARAVKQVMADGRLRWRCWACWTDASGQYRRERVYGATKQEAEEAAARVRAKGRGESGLDPKQVTVGEFLATWLDGLPGIGGATRHRYGHHVTLHLIPALGTIKLAKLSPLQIRSFIRDEETAGLAPHTITAHLSRLKHALNDAVSWGLLERNPCQGIKPPRPHESTAIIWTTAQLRQFLAKNREHALYPVWLLAIGTGCRIGELAALRWGDVDLEHRRLHIQRTATRTADGKDIIGTTTKSRRSRTLPLPASCAEALKAHWEQFPGTPETFVFRNADGHGWRTGKLRQRFGEACRRAKVPETHPHTLRHLTATWLAEQGVPVHIIQAILGHSGVAMTLRYGHVTPAMEEAAAQALDRAITGTDSHQFGTGSGQQAEKSAP